MTAKCYHVIFTFIYLFYFVVKEKNIYIPNHFILIKNSKNLDDEKCFKSVLQSLKSNCIYRQSLQIYTVVIHTYLTQLNISLRSRS